MANLSVIFDLDGTLLDTLAGLARVGNQVLAEAGLPQHPCDAYRHFVGDGVEKLVSRMSPPGTDADLLAEILARFRRLYGESWREDCRPYPGIVEMLAGLRQDGCTMAVLSNKPHQFTLDFVTVCLGGETFAVVYGERPGIPRKPDPTVALAILAGFGSPPAESLFIGDSAVDMHTAKAAGMVAIGVAWGFRGETELLANGADHILRTPMDLNRYVAACR
jgi:phosphoglycolate phosphatase